MVACLLIDGFPDVIQCGEKEGSYHDMLNGESRSCLNTAFLFFSWDLTVVGGCFAGEEAMSASSNF